MLNFETILQVTKEVLHGEVPVKQAAAPDGAFVSANPDTILAATEKLLAVNRGATDADERDSLEFRRVHTPANLMAERVALDNGKLRLTLMRRLAKQRTLKALPVAHFDPYTEGMVVGHALSSPLEEINPMQLVEQNRRITAMGPGGLASDDQITPEAQNVHPSQFTFLDALAGPESSRIGIDTRVAWGTKLGNDGQIYQQFHSRRTGKRHWLAPTDLRGKTIGLPE